MDASKTPEGNLMGLSAYITKKKKKVFKNSSQEFRKEIKKKIQKQDLEFNNKRAEINLIKYVQNK